MQTHNQYPVTGHQMTSGTGAHPPADAHANTQAQPEEAARSGTVNPAQVLMSQHLQLPAEGGGQA